MGMAYSAVRWTIGGDCLTGREIWSTGFWTGNDASDLPGEEVPEATVDAVAARWATFFTGAGSNFSDQYKTNFVKAAYWHYDGVAGKDKTFGTPIYHTYSPIIQGNSVSMVFPPQLTLAASFKSGYRNGTASNGRMYLPGINKAVTGNDGGGLPIADVTTILTAFKTFINGVNTDTVPGDAGKVILVGHGEQGNFPPHESKNAYVTDVRLGNYYDTQRRRRNGIREVYQTQGIA